MLWGQQFSSVQQEYLKVGFTSNNNALMDLCRNIRSFSNIINSDTTNDITVTTSGWNYVTVTDSLGCTSTDSIYVSIEVCGCTDPTAVNYNASVTLDDGSCIPYIYGYDSTIFYDSTALILMMVLVFIVIFHLLSLYLLKILLVIVMGGYWLNSHLLILQLLCFGVMDL